jgi:hypothetical protein
MACLWVSIIEDPLYMQVKYVYQAGAAKEQYVKRTDTIRQLKLLISPLDSPDSFQVQVPTLPPNANRPDNSRIVSQVMNDGVTLDISALSPPSHGHYANSPTQLVILLAVR